MKTIKGIIIILTLSLFGCSENSAMPRAKSIDGLNEMISLKIKTKSEYERVLSEVTILPRAGILSKQEILSLGDILHQMVVHADSHGIKTINLPASCDLFLSLDASLAEVPGWSLIEQRAHANGAVEVYAITAFIMASQL